MNKTKTISVDGWPFAYDELKFQSTEKINELTALLKEVIVEFGTAGYFDVFKQSDLLRRIKAVLEKKEE